MISIFDEDLVKLKDAAKLLPNRPHLATLYRWCDGVNVAPKSSGKKIRVQLETVVIANERFTSKQAVQRFIEAYTLARDGRQVDPPSRATGERQHGIKAARKALSQAGI